MNINDCRGKTRLLKHTVPIACRGEDPGFSPSALDTAAGYARRGWAPVPIPFRRKRPVLEGWQNLRIGEAEAPRHFNGQPQNIGVILGEPSGNLVDVDLDCAEAVKLARFFLPPTEALFGRAGKARSHWLYIAAAPKRLEFSDPADGGMLLELRSNGGQTVFPGSVHESGEPVEWAEDGDPARVDAGQLTKAVERLAAGCLLVRSAPAEGRHEYLLEVSGALVRGLGADGAANILGPVAWLILGDLHSAAEGRRLIDGTARKLAAGEPVPGWPKLAERVGDKRARKLAEWLGVDQRGRQAEAAEDGWEAPLLAAVAELNGRYFVADLSGKGVIASLRHDAALERERLVFSRRDDLKLLFEHRRCVVGHTRKGGQITQDLGSAWLAHPLRRTYREIALIPDGPCPPDVFNLWRGFGVEPKPGGWGTLERHLREVVCSGDEQHFRWLLGWLARCVQHPGQQAEVAVVLRGLKGTGKGMLGRMLTRIFRNHGLHITHSRHLVGNFNAHLVDALFLFLDEAFWAGDKQGEGTLKALITERTLMIEPKGVDPFPMPNRLKILMASNNDWVVPASADERRYFVLDVSDRRKGDREYFAKLDAAIEGDELPALLHDLLGSDLSGFDHRDPPHTDGLNKQKLIGGDSLLKFWSDCLTDGQIVGAEAGDGWPSTVPCQDLKDAYLEHAQAHGARHPLTSEQMGVKLRQLCPDGGLKTFRPTARHPGDPRPRSFELKSLEEHRAAFLKAMNIAAHAWPEVEGGG